MPTSSRIVAAVISALLVGIGVLTVVLVIQGAARRLCHIEQLGAAARPHLIQMFVDVQKAQSLPKTRAQQLAERHQSAAQRQISSDFNRQLAAYLTIAQQQPTPGSC